MKNTLSSNKWFMTAVENPSKVNSHFHVSHLRRHGVKIKSPSEQTEQEVPLTSIDCVNVV